MNLKKHMSVKDFVEGLPSYNRLNFSNLNSEQKGWRINSKRPSVYVATEEQPEAQLIVLDQSCALSRYLRNLWDKKPQTRKRALALLHSNAVGDVGMGRKRSRREPSGQI